ncbi:hypothetical protein VTJ49DRAFT_5977 [Mycothermus thermophilus]|uniref:Uncharacterized protein n=1 Tax=Humicola insolens TaxID=85995 RepID=A0ABR3V3J9_HUMIN
MMLTSASTQLRAKEIPAVIQSSPFIPASAQTAYLITLIPRHAPLQKVMILTAARVWQRGQLGEAEMLVAALSGSYLYQRGFNVREAGANPDVVPESRWLDEETYVFATIPHLRQNVRRSLQDVDRATEIKEAEEELGELPDIQRDADTCIARLEHVKSKASKLKEQKKPLEQVLAADQEYLLKLVERQHTAEQAETFLRQVIDVLKQIP